METACACLCAATSSLFELVPCTLCQSAARSISCALAVRDQTHYLSQTYNRHVLDTEHAHVILFFVIASRAISMMDGPCCCRGYTCVQTLPTICVPTGIGPGLVFTRSRPCVHYGFDFSEVGAVCFADESDEDAVGAVIADRRPGRHGA